MKIIQGIKIDVVKKTVEKIAVEDGLSGLYTALECDCVDRVRITDTELLWLDDNGLIIDEPLGAFTIGNSNPFSGHGLILGATDDGNSCDTSLDVEFVKQNVLFCDIAELPDPSFKITKF